MHSKFLTFFLLMIRLKSCFVSNHIYGTQRELIMNNVTILNPRLFSPLIISLLGKTESNPEPFDLLQRHQVIKILRPMRSQTGFLKLKKVIIFHKAWCLAKHHLAVHTLITYCIRNKDIAKAEECEGE